MENNSVQLANNLSTSLSCTAKITSDSIKNQKNFASTAYSFIKNKIPTNLKVLFKENPKVFGLFVLTCVATSATVIALAAVALAAFSTGNIPLGIVAILRAVGVGIAGYKFGSYLLKSDIDLKEKSLTILGSEFNECTKENNQLDEKKNILKSRLDHEKEKRFSILEKLNPVEKKYKEKLQNMHLRSDFFKKMSDTEKTEFKDLRSEYKWLKNEKSLVKDSLENIRSEISEQQQKIQYNELKMMRIKAAVEKYSAEYSANVLKDKSDEKVNDKNLGVSFSDNKYS